MTSIFKNKSILLLIQVFVVSSCSLCYELLLATTATNLTGNSVLAFSLSIGLFLAGLGSGSFVTRWIGDTDLNEVFVWTETVLALFGGFSVILLHLSLVYTPYFLLMQIFLTFGVGFISGLEIPVLTRILNIDPKLNLKGVLANVLSFDYLGGLAASVLFPIILLPFFGLVRLNFIVGLVNLSMAVLAYLIFKEKLKYHLLHIIAFFGLGTVLLSGAVWSTQIYNFVESGMYRDPILYSKQTPYQRLVITLRDNDLRLYINGGIQFSSKDEYRYHESLVIPSMLQLIQSNENLKIAIFGGGDGLGVRELLKFEKWIDKIDLVDLDPEMTNLGKNSTLLKNLNQDSLSSSKVNIINRDAFEWIKSQSENSIDLIISDLPDPDDTPLAKLYSQEMFKFSYKALKSSGIIVTQSSSPYSTPVAFWCTNKTLSSVFPKVYPYQVYVPSFGLWGYNLAFKDQNQELILDGNLNQSELNSDQIKILNSNQFLKSTNLTTLFNLEPDILSPKLQNGAPIDIQNLKINTLDNLILVKYYNENGLESN